MHRAHPVLIKKYKRAWDLRARAPISVAITPPGDLRHADFRQSSSHHELFRIKCPFYDPHPSPSYTSHSPPVPLTLFLALLISPSLSLPCSLPRASTLFGLIAPQRPSSTETWRETPSLPNPDRTKKYIVQRPPERGSYLQYRVFRA